PAWPIQDRSSTVFPLPAGADTTITRADPSSRSHSPCRETTAARAAQRPNIGCAATTPPAWATGSSTVVISFLLVSPSAETNLWLACAWRAGGTPQIIGVAVNRPGQVGQATPPCRPHLTAFRL